MLAHKLCFETKDVFIFGEAEPLLDELVECIKNAYEDKGVLAGIVVTEGYESYAVEVIVENIPDVETWDAILAIARYMLESILPR